jgi:hypothetical protein
MNKNLYTDGFLIILIKIYFHDIRGTPCGAPFENHWYKVIRFCCALLPAVSLGPAECAGVFFGLN